MLDDSDTLKWTVIGMIVYDMTILVEVACHEDGDVIVIAILHHCHDNLTVIHSDDSTFTKG